MDKIKNLTDFTIEIPEKREVVILQVTDTQPVDAGQKRFETRIKDSTPLTEEKRYETIYRFIDDGIKRAKPELIIITGDIIYGEFDDSGENLLSFIRFMESKKIPWAPVFGNHDNESKKGALWQCEQFEKAEHCLFKRGEVTGNGNYSIGISVAGKLARVIYMLDSNGCTQAYRYFWYCDNYPDYNEGEKVKTEDGFGEDQVKWLASSAEMVDDAEGRKVPKFACFHIPVDNIAGYAFKKGYISDEHDAKNEEFNIGKTVDAKDGDFGLKAEKLSGFHYDGIMDILKKAGIDGVFVGHQHNINASILCDGIRFTFGLKTGLHDYHRETGTTKITFDPSGDAFNIEHLYLD